MNKISNEKITIPLLAIASILTISIVSFSPNIVSAYNDQFEIPEISGTITISDESENYSENAKITLSVAMAVGENSVENGKAMWGKLDVIQGFLVYKIGVLANDDYLLMNEQK